MPIIINIKTDIYPNETEWTWQKRNATDRWWNIVEHSDGELQRSEFLHSYQVSVALNNTYKLSVTDVYYDGLEPPGYITMTHSNRTTLFSYQDQGPFAELAVEVQVHMLGSLEVEWVVIL